MSGWVRTMLMCLMRPATLYPRPPETASAIRSQKLPMLRVTSMRPSLPILLAANTSPKNWYGLRTYPRSGTGPNRYGVRTVSMYGTGLRRSRKQFPAMSACERECRQPRRNASYILETDTTVGSAEYRWSVRRSEIESGARTQMLYGGGRRMPSNTRHSRRCGCNTIICSRMRLVARMNCQTLWSPAPPATSGE
jgi:hypothetical protein